MKFKKESLNKYKDFKKKMQSSQDEHEAISLKLVQTKKSQVFNIPSNQ